MPRRKIVAFVQKRSSPTSSILDPSSSVSSFQPSQSFSHMPSSKETIGYCRHQDVQSATISSEVFSAPPHFTGRRIETKCDVIARPVTSFGDRFENNFYGFFVRSEVWRKPTFVTNSGVVASLTQYAAKRVEGLHTHADRFSE